MTLRVLHPVDEKQPDDEKMRIQFENALRDVLRKRPNVVAILYETERNIGWVVVPHIESALYGLLLLVQQELEANHES